MPQVKFLPESARGGVFHPEEQKHATSQPVTDRHPADPLRYQSDNLRVHSPQTLGQAALSLGHFETIRHWRNYSCGLLLFHDLHVTVHR